MKSCRRWQVSKTPLARLCAVGAAVAVAVTSNSAHAEGSAYCRKVRARAAAEASLLIAPTVLAEGVRVPSALQPNGKLDPTSPGHGYQLRAGLSLSPLNVYKGVRVMKVGDADCEQHESVVIAQELIRNAADLGRLGALREQAAYLDTQKPIWEGVAAKVTERFASQAATLIELEDVRSRTAVLARQRAQIGGEIERLEAAGVDDYRGTIGELARQIKAKSMSFEREASHVRSLDAWTVNLTGGYLPPIYGPGTSDIFGVVQVGYNVGGPFQHAAEGRYLDAREEELQKSRHELGRRLQVLREGVTAARSQAGRELEIVEKRISEIMATRGAVERSDAPSAVYVLARIDLELVGVQADRVFLTGIIREFSRLEVN